MSKYTPFDYLYYIKQSNILKKKHLMPKPHLIILGNSIKFLQEILKSV